jgi:pyridinium-3,5-bisthiocarboxylic acid mononucleotide nickel chelatase
MKTHYFDVMSGASGDMILSALVDIGVPNAYLRRELAKLKIPGFTFDVNKQKRCGISASHLKMKWDTPRSYRHLHQILAMIKKAGYKASVYSKCEEVLMQLGKAEAKVHDMALEKVHFHEVGAVDTIVDIAGICLGLDYLGVDEIVFSTLTDGKGTVNTQHGTMPVPVPAVAAMAEGYELCILDIPTELLTPTGCAVLTALGRQEKSGMSGRIIKSGYGCGDKVLEKTPNVLRVFLCEAGGESSVGHVAVIESDMDHISGEIMGDAAALLMRQGALDVSWAPVFMKKGRPGYRLTMLCASDRQQDLIDTIMLHTRTLGVRVHTARRVVAQRKPAKGRLRGQAIEVKECSYKGHSFTKPEYAALARISGTTGVPVVELMEEYVRGEK